MDGYLETERERYTGKFRFGWPLHVEGTYVPVVVN